MSRLVLVVPLRQGSLDRVRELLAEGPPFELATTRLERHEVYLTDREAVFVFEAPGEAPPLRLRAGNPALRTAAAAWRECMEGRPRKAETAFSWLRET
ncbi:MAG TPA: hypothetical protein VD769_06205 [Gaiellaceae bacterium]|nr:hypothetical protein [Gaiellaceae bacterium]